jgi:hypothetical protein
MIDVIGKSFGDVGLGLTGTNPGKLFASLDKMRKKR